MQVHLYESQTYVFMTRLTLGLSPETPTPNPAPRGGELFSARFFGAKARKTALSGFPLPLGRGSGGWVFRLHLPRTWVKRVESLISVPQVI